MFKIKVKIVFDCILFLKAIYTHFSVIRLYCWDFISYLYLYKDIESRSICFASAIKLNHNIDSEMLVVVNILHV